MGAKGKIERFDLKQHSWKGFKQACLPRPLILIEYNKLKKQEGIRLPIMC